MYRHRGIRAALLALPLLLISPPAVPPPDPHDVHPAAHAAAGAHTARAAPAAPPELALRLQALLGQHSALAADFMRGRIRGDEDFVQAADAALGTNTEAMAGVVGDLFGGTAAERFTPLWRDHVVALFDYARAVADQDEAGRAQARQTLTAFELELGGFFAAASGGRLSEADARSAVLAHVRHLLDQADAYAAQDLARADRLYRDAYRHAYDLGGTLAAVLLPPEHAATLREPIWRLRSELAKLLAEHVFLAVGATRAAVTDAPGFAVAAQLVDANTRDLATAVDSLFGAPAAGRFQDLWASHIDQLVAYAAGTAAGDEGRRDRARAALRAFEPRLASFLQAATGRRLGAAALTTVLLQHDGMLLEHADAFAAKDYRAAHDLAYRTYAHMTEVARQLADAFGATVAARLPVGGARTGLGGTAAGPR